MDRREFFRKGGRLAILAGIGLLGTFLAYNKKIGTTENCPIATQCKNCGKYAKCTLPQANNIRSNGK